MYYNTYRYVKKKKNYCKSLSKIQLYFDPFLFFISYIFKVSRKSRKVKKKKIPEGTESGDKPTADHSCIQNETGISTVDQSAENQPLQECLPNANSTGEDVVPDDNDHENHVEEDLNSQVGLEPMEATNSEHVNEGMLDGTNDFSEDEQLNSINEVDFKVSTLVSAFANHNIIQKLCWLLKFYKSNSLATNHYIISMLKRISDELELHPMLYQVKSRKPLIFDEIV